MHSPLGSVQLSYHSDSEHSPAKFRNPPKTAFNCRVIRIWKNQVRRLQGTFNPFDQNLAFS